jgi:tRNA(Ile)-lysidine synthase
MNKKKKSNLVFSVESFITENRLFEPGSRILVGVSGGPDSMALLSILTELRPTWDLELLVFYAHHGLRSEADEEEAFVRFRAKKWNCPFFHRKLPVLDFQRGSGLSLEEAARVLRYQAFEEVMKAKKAHRLALAHTANDQAEEVLIGLIRGAGLGGLSGIPLRRESLIRPLLSTYRPEILDYLKSADISFREDRSNKDFRFLRARIRHQLLPELKKYSPNITAQLNQTARLLQEDESTFQENIRPLAERLLTYDGSTASICRSGLAALPQALGSRLIQTALLKGMGHLRHIRAVHILSILRAAKGGRDKGRIALPQGWSARWDQKDIKIGKIAAESLPSPSFIYVIDKPGTVFIRETGESIIFKKIKNSMSFSQRLKNKYTAGADWQKIVWPLVIRNAGPGDRFQPLGLEGTKKVSRFFMDRKIPPTLRSRFPLVLCAGKIVWIAGMEIDHSFRLDSQSTEVLEMTYQKQGLD